MATTMGSMGQSTSVEEQAGEDRHPLGSMKRKSMVEMNEARMRKADMVGNIETNCLPRVADHTVLCVHPSISSARRADRKRGRTLVETRMP